MLRFASKRSGPPGGMYFYEVPETGVAFQHPGRTALVESVRKHYYENNLECPGDLESRLEDFMCRMLPAGFCTGDDEGRPRRKAVSYGSIREATLKLATGNPRVDPGEAERRALACSRCPLNDRTACTSCSGMTEWARKLSGKTLTGLDSALGICHVDCTALSAKVHLRDIPASDEYPETCWRYQHD